MVRMPVEPFAPELLIIYLEHQVASAAFWRVADSVGVNNRHSITTFSITDYLHSFCGRLLDKDAAAAHRSLFRCLVDHCELFM